LVSSQVFEWLIAGMIMALSSKLLVEVHYDRIYAANPIIRTHHVASMVDPDHVVVA
jgi:hypothetical protein